MLKTIRVFAAPRLVNGEWEWNNRPIAELAEPPQWVYAVLAPPVSSRVRAYSSTDHKVLFESTRKYLFEKRFFEVLYVLYTAKACSDGGRFLVEFSS